MEKFTKLDAVAAPLNMINVDTDMIIPKQFLKTIKRSGLGKNLFDEMRYGDDGSEIEDFVLNQSAYRNAQILVAGANFAAAPAASTRHGHRLILALNASSRRALPIFYNNCSNGILPIVLPQEDIDKLMDDAARGANAGLSIDLEAQEIRGPDGGVIGFEVDAFRKTCLLEGLDDIALTLKQSDEISAYEAGLDDQPWR